MYTHPQTFTELASIAPDLGVRNVADYRHTAMICGCVAQCYIKSDVLRNVHSLDEHACPSSNSEQNVPKYHQDN